MNTKRRRCAGTNAQGGACQSPMVGEDGYCTAHRDGGSAAMAERGRKGAESLRKHWRGQVLDEKELPPLRTPQDVEQWLEVIGRAVATGRLSHNQGRTIATTVREWLKAHEAGKVSQKIEELSEAVAKLRVER